ncbi:hypothetical protein PLICRDRAFT_100279, partial [Plicaturopsis crispa FD-325 SS-3]
MRTDEPIVQLNAAQLVHSANVARRKTSDEVPPRRTNAMQHTLAAEINVNGVLAYTLFDSGSTTDSLTPEFARVSGAHCTELPEQVTLQLGCVGSKSKISYGTAVPVTIGPIIEDVYFDLVNLDRYDCIIGTPFMNRHNVCLDFGSQCIRLGDDAIPALTVKAEAAIVVRPPPARRPWDKVSPGDECAKILGPLPLELPPMRAVVHNIPLINDDARYQYHMPRCPDALKQPLREKINRYVDAGWWELKPVAQAAPLLCVPKKDGG